MLFIYFMIENFLDTRSWFLPANQRAHLTSHNQSTFVWRHNRVYILWSKHTDWPMSAYYPNYRDVTTANLWHSCHILTFIRISVNNQGWEHALLVTSINRYKRSHHSEVSPLVLRIQHWCRFFLYGIKLSQSQTPGGGLKKANTGRLSPEVRSHTL